jgi:hypothetical protein
MLSGPHTQGTFMIWQLTVTPGTLLTLTVHSLLHDSLLVGPAFLAVTFLAFRFSPATELHFYGHSGPLSQTHSKRSTCTFLFFFSSSARP